jgi:8-oxo-dGTP pyrophosphatase MutT (NUDIX family)
MNHTNIVTSFLQDDSKILLLKRSDKVKSMKGLWAGVSGIIENNEIPINRAKIEIWEETGIEETQITLLKSVKEMRVRSSQYKNHEWNIFPFLFQVDNPKIKLNWENSEYRWIDHAEITNYETVPNLDNILSNLL